LTPCRLGLVPHERVRDLTERFPHLARVYWFMTNMDAAIHREWTLSLGRRTALSRMSHLFSEMNVRLGLVGLAEDGSYNFPLTQIELGECLGLTSVHVNRTLQELRRMRLIELENRRVTILDLPALHGLADFDPAYLYLEKRPR
jgi:CRP-like cAMP-binding protein